MNDLDAATRALYEQFPAPPALDREPARLGATVVIVPGAFYRTHRRTGADGRVIREEAERLGARTALIPLPNLGTLAGNARMIRDWLTARPDERIILVSLSKGSADVRAALAESAAFARVCAWINVSGALDGSPLVDWLFAGSLRSYWTRLLLRMQGHNIEAIRELRHRPTPFTLPGHLQAIHVLGFPARQHLASAMARRWHKRLAPLGPNDGCGLLLADALRWPGSVVPVWGADHYLCEQRPLIRQVFAMLDEVEIPV